MRTWEALLWCTPLKLCLTGLGPGIDKDRPHQHCLYWRVGGRPHIWRPAETLFQKKLARLEAGPWAKLDEAAAGVAQPLAALPNSADRLSATLACLPLASHRARALRPADFCGLRNRTPHFSMPTIAIAIRRPARKKISFNPARAPPMLFGLFAGPFCGASLQRNRP